MHQAVRYLLYSQVCFLFFICVCIALAPDTLLHNAPASYYGTLARTVVPYALGMLSATYFLFKASNHLGKGPELRFIKRSIRAVACIMIGILLIPYSINELFFEAHRVLAIGLLLTALSTSIYIIWRIDRRPRNILLFGLELLAATLVLLSAQFIRVFELAGLGELLLNLTLALLICNTVHDLLSKPPATHR